MRSITSLHRPRAVSETVAAAPDPPVVKSYDP